MNSETIFYLYKNPPFIKGFQLNFKQLFSMEGNISGNYKYLALRKKTWIFFKTKMWRRGDDELLKKEKRQTI